MTGTYYHGTSLDRLPSVLEHGILTTEQVAWLGHAINNPTRSEGGFTYVTTNPQDAADWATRHGRFGVVLEWRYDGKQPLQFKHDKELSRYGRWVQRYGVKGPIAPDGLRVAAIVEHQDDGVFEWTAATRLAA